MKVSAMRGGKASGGAERPSAIAMERARADESERVTRLLQGIVAGTRTLLDAPDFEPALNEWLRMMCEAQGASSASFYDVVVHEVARTRTVRCLADWSPHAPGERGRLPISFASPLVIDPRGGQTADLLLASLGRGELVAIHATDLTGKAREQMEAQRHATTIEAPIMDGDRWIGAISFDYWERKELNGRDEAVLRTAADALASVLRRNELQERLVGEQRARADDNARLADILQSVVRSSRELIEETDFERGINRWLKTLGERTEAARASFYDTHGEPGSPGEHQRSLAEWVRDGVGGSMPMSFAEPLPIPVDHGSEGWRALKGGRPYAFQLSDAVGDTWAHLASQGNATVLLIPFFVGERLWSVSFDFLEPRAFDERYLSILQTAANSIATEIGRRQAEDGRLAAERVRTEAAEAARHDLIRRKDLLEAVVETSDRLLQAVSLDETAGAWTAERIGQALGADRLCLGRFLPPDARSAVGYCLWEHEWTAPGVPRQTDMPGLKMLDMAGYAEFHARLDRGEPLAIITDDIANDQGRAEQEQIGVLSQFVYPIRVDGQLWGAINADDCTVPRLWDEAEVATLRLVASAIGSLVKRERLTQAHLSVERELAEERARMAREIHDTLAQGFTGVIMQVHATQDALEARDVADAERHMARALDRARAGLSEARRSVYTLRPPLLDDGDLARALRLVVAQLFEGTDVVASFELEGEPRPLAEETSIELFRIAQEALNNALRHARATRVSVALSFCEEERVGLSVSDDGSGLDAGVQAASPSGFGLVSMRERAARISATFVLASELGRGTRVAVSAPTPARRRDGPEPSAVLTLQPASPS